MKKLLTTIFLFAVFSNLSAEISVKSFRKLDNDMTARIYAPKRDQNGDMCAIIKVVTTQTGFVWEPDGLGIVSAESKDGEYWLYVPFGAKRLTIKHARLGVLREYLYSLPIERASVYEMVLVTGKVITTVEEIEKQWLVITPYPENAMIYIDDNFVSKGEYQAQRIPGIFSYRVEAPLYHTEAGKIELKDDKKELKISLKPAFGFLNITTTPETGATIIVDSKELTKTSPTITDALASGEHTVQVIKEMYQPTTLKVIVKDGETTPLSFNLSPNFAEINIDSSSEANILVNGQVKGKGKWSGRLRAGVYTIETQLENHQPAKQDVDLKVGDLKTIELFPVPIYGILDVITSPSGASISINGNSYGSTPITLKNLFPGDYNIVLKKDLYDPIQMKVKIEANKKSIINEILPFGTQINFESNPSEIQLNMDGFQVGKTPLTLNLKNGKHILKLINGNKIVVDTIDIYAGCKTTYNYDLSEILTPIRSKVIANETPVTVQGRKMSVKEFYKQHFLATSYAYHETSFSNSTFSDRIKDGSITIEYGQAVAVYTVLYPFELSVTAFMSGFTVRNIAPFNENGNITHRGIECNVNIMPFSIGRYIIPYVGAGYQLSQLYSKDGSEIISGDIISSITLPVVKGGLKLKFGHFFLFGEYKQTFAIEESDYQSSQLSGGIGWIF